MHSLTPQEKKAALEFKKRAKKILGSNFLELLLFGSRARGEGNEESDVDILVLLNEAPASVRGRLFEIAADLLLEYEIDLSPLVMSKTHFEDMKRRERLLPLEIERDGKKL